MKIHRKNTIKVLLITLSLLGTSLSATHGRSPISVGTTSPPQSVIVDKNNRDSSPKTDNISLVQPDSTPTTNKLNVRPQRSKSSESLLSLGSLDSDTEDEDSGDKKKKKTLSKTVQKKLLSLSKMNSTMQRKEMQDLKAMTNEIRLQNSSPTKARGLYRQNGRRRLVDFNHVDPKVQHQSGSYARVGSLPSDTSGNRFASRNNSYDTTIIHGTPRNDGSMLSDPSGNFYSNGYYVNNCSPQGNPHHHPTNFLQGNRWAYPQQQPTFPTNNDPHNLNNTQPYLFDNGTISYHNPKGRTQSDIQYNNEYRYTNGQQRKVNSEHTLGLRGSNVQQPPKKIVGQNNGNFNRSTDDHLNNQIGTSSGEQPPTKVPSNSSSIVSQKEETTLSDVNLSPRSVSSRSEESTSSNRGGGSQIKEYAPSTIFLGLISACLGLILLQKQYGLFTWQLSEDKPKHPAPKTTSSEEDQEENTTPKTKQKKEEKRRYFPFFLPW